MKIKPALLIFALLLLVSLPLKAAETVRIKAFDTMKYDLSKITAKPGQKMTVELTNEGTLPKATMGHNWILLKAGSDAGSYSAAAMKAKAQDYQPPALANEVLASIGMLGPKESGKTSFTAPSTPGSYPFLCSFPGHYQSGMKGVLIVK
ncbi:MAG: plastocyanin/azurin family copper-binding protein [Verrucomicrobiota bacterium]|nr:plastocyanin/azurin family copper-binding protein [Verrucomicrobiota bacterium]